ncbi:hypothetical protein EMIT0194P_60247 [Pseudomonas serbica]
MTELIGCPKKNTLTVDKYTDRGDAVNIALNRGMLDKSTYQLALRRGRRQEKHELSGCR